MSIGNTDFNNHDADYFSRNERFGVKATKKTKKGSGNNPGSPDGFWKEFVNIVISVAVAFVLFIVIRTYLFYPFQVVGDSMVPTLATGDRLILNRLAKIDRFDIVVFPAPDGSGEEYVKRIIGLPGDEITYFQDTLYINGEKVDEHYLEPLKEAANGQVLTPDFTLFSLESTKVSVVPEDTYFVLGDNRSVSKDSRVFGFIPAAQIEGTADLRIWPIAKIGIMDDNK